MIACFILRAGVAAIAMPAPCCLFSFANNKREFSRLASAISVADI